MLKSDGRSDQNMGNRIKNCLEINKWRINKYFLAIFGKYKKIAYLHVLMIMNKLIPVDYT